MKPTECTEHSKYSKTHIRDTFKIAMIRKVQECTIVVLSGKRNDDLKMNFVKVF